MDNRYSHIIVTVAEIWITLMGKFADLQYAQPQLSSYDLACTLLQYDGQSLIASSHMHAHTHDQLIQFQFTITGVHPQSHRHDTQPGEHFSQTDIRSCLNTPLHVQCISDYPCRASAHTHTHT